MSFILALESSTQVCSVAVKQLDGLGEVVELFENHSRRQAEFLLPMVQSVLQKANCELKECAAITVANGPGSFIGIRTVCGIAQGLAYGIDSAVIPVPTLQVLAQVAFEKHQCKKVLAAWDARMDEIYLGGYELDANNIMQNIIADKLISPSEVKLEGEGWVAIGNAWDVCSEALQKNGILDGLENIYAEDFPRASSLISIAEQQLKTGEGVVSALELQPVYLRVKVTG